MIHGYVGHSRLPRDPDSIVSIIANLVSSTVWAAQVGLGIKSVEGIDVPGG